MALVFATGATAALARDNDHGHGRGDDQQESRGRHDDRRGDVRVGGYFRDQDREAARSWYAQQGRGGHCPPGLAKKNNGCMPPGHARHFNPGQPLPRDVVIRPVPQPVLVRLPPPPVGYRYAQAGTDIVLMQPSNRVVVDVLLSF